MRRGKSKLNAAWLSCVLQSLTVFCGCLLSLRAESAFSVPCASSGSCTAHLYLVETFFGVQSSRAGVRDVCEKQQIQDVSLRNPTAELGGSHWDFFFFCSGRTVLFRVGGFFEKVTYE